MTTTNEPRTIDITPHWPGMFRLAVQMCRDGLEQGQGRDLVIEMLEFGARLESARATAPDLLAALKALMESIETLNFGAFDDDGATYDQIPWAQAEDAIKQATKESI